MRLRLWGFLSAIVFGVYGGLVAAEPPRHRPQDQWEVIGGDPTKVYEGPCLAIPLKKDDSPKCARGHKHPTAEVLKVRHAEAFKRHDHRNKHLPVATPAAFDIEAMGWGTPIRDQRNCGSCWNVSACDVITAAYVKAGQAKGDGSFEISPQYVMDCENTGGCDGDDAPHVMQICKDKGIPSEADYGPYTASSNRCKYTNQKRYKIHDFLYCTPSQEQGMAATQDMKNALVAYGQLSTAIVADSSWDNVGADGAIPYEKSSPGQIDHDVSIVGWDDNKQIPRAPTKGAWKVKNQWGKWGAGGYCWIAYGSHQIGTEACAPVVAALPPLPPDPPGPPNPPTPGTGFTGTITDTTTTSYVGGVKGASVTITSVSGANPGGLDAAGISPPIVADVQKLFADIRAKAGKDIILADVLKILSDLGP